MSGFIQCREPNSMYARQTLQLSSTPSQRKSLNAIPALHSCYKDAPLSVPTEKPFRLSPAVFWVWQRGLSTLPRGKKVNGLIPRKKVFHGASDRLSAPSCGCLGDASLKGRHGGGWPDNPGSSGSPLSWLVIVLLGCYDELFLRGVVLRCQNSQFWFWRLCCTRGFSQKSTRCEVL